MLEELSVHRSLYGCYARLVPRFVILNRENGTVALDPYSGRAVSLARLRRVFPDLEMPDV